MSRADSVQPRAGVSARGLADAPSIASQEPPQAPGESFREMGELPLVEPGDRKRAKKSGAQRRREAREREQSLYFEVKYPIQLADFECLVDSGDLAPDDIKSPTRMGVALENLAPEMAECFASRNVAPDYEEKIQEFEPTLFQTPLPGCFVRLGDARHSDLEMAFVTISAEARKMAVERGWLEKIRQRLPFGLRVCEAFDLEELRSMRRHAEAAIATKYGPSQ
jgi:hypothetical protein